MLASNTASQIFLNHAGKKSRQKRTTTSYRTL